MELLLRALALDPDNAEIKAEEVVAEKRKRADELKRLGDEQLAAGEYVAALGSYTAAIALNPGDAELPPRIDEATRKRARRAWTSALPPIRHTLAPSDRSVRFAPAGREGAPEARRGGVPREGLRGRGGRLRPGPRAVDRSRRRGRDPGPPRFCQLSAATVAVAPAQLGAAPRQVAWPDTAEIQRERDLAARKLRALELLAAAQKLLAEGKLEEAVRGGARAPPVVGRFDCCARH
jgi:tetratricopeptide (TPR) repeat protein